MLNVILGPKEEENTAYIRGPTMAEIPSFIKLLLPIQVIGYVKCLFM